MKVGFAGVVSAGVPMLLAEVVRSSDSLDSNVDAVAAMECVSRDFLDSGGDPLSKSRDLSLLSLALPLSLLLSVLMPKKEVKDGAAGLSFGVKGRCEDTGLVPIGAWRGLGGSRRSMYSSPSLGFIDKLLVEP